MEITFTLKLFLSFLVGGLYITFATIVADKLGSKIGGLLTGLPSTLAFGLLFIALTQSPEKAVQATNISPAIGIVGIIFMVSYLYFSKKSLWIGLFLATALWLTLSLGLILFQIEHFFLFLLLYFPVSFVAYYIVEQILHTPSSIGKKITYTPFMLLMRGFLSGFIIALSVLLAKIGGPLWGGAFSMFPAATIGAIIITSHAHGSTFSQGIVKGVLLSMNIYPIYIIVIRYAYPSLGITLGTILAFAASYFAAFLLYSFVMKKSK